MELNFTKYQGTGNDFIMVDNHDGAFDALTNDDIQRLCSRKFGIGADGLIKISADSIYDFYVDYYNSDGSQSFCGNGARCSVAFAKELGLVQEHTTFRAIDGVHKASIGVDGRVRLEMLPVIGYERIENDFVLNTGSPHFVRFVQPNNVPDIRAFGKEIRYSDRFAKEGINVNTVIEIGPETLHVATYERGVEDETLSCGTGVTACALAYMVMNDHFSEVSVSTKGGKLSVKAQRTPDGFDGIWLIGPAKKVYSGSINF